MKIIKWNAGLGRENWPLAKSLDCRGFLRRCLCLVVLLLLQGCLSSGSDSDSGNNPAEPDYVTWSNNSNGEVILDYNNEHFAVLRSGVLVYLASRNSSIRLENVAVSDTGKLYLNNQLFGEVALLPGSSGGAVAALVWTDASSKAYHIDVQHTGDKSFILYRTNALASSRLNSGSPSTGNSSGGQTDNSAFASATQITDRTLVGGTINLSTRQYFSFVASGTGLYNVAIYFSQYSDLDLYLYDSSYSEIASSLATSGGSESITGTLNAGTRYYAVVSAYSISTQSGNESFDFQVRPVSSGLSMPSSEDSPSVRHLQVSDTKVKAPTVSVESLCKEPEAIELQFFNSNKSAYWPGREDSFVINGRSTIPLRCAAGEFVCYSARTSDGQHVWGINELGQAGCSDCCFACDTPADITFTCDE